MLGADRPHGGVELDGHALCAGLDPEAVELAVLDRAPRPVGALADGAAEVAVLGAGDFEALYDDNPRLQAALLTNLLAGAYRHIGRATAEIASLSGSHRVGGT